MYYCKPNALYNHIMVFSITTSVLHPLGWCDDSQRTTVPVRSLHASFRWRRLRDL